MDVLEDLAAAPAQAGQLSLLDAYSTVHYGDLTSRDFVKAVYAGMPPGLSGARVSAPELPVDGLVIWDGPIPPPKGRPPKPGHFWVANPYKSAAVQKIAPGYSRQHGYGLQASDIAAITAIFAEVDEAPEGGPLAIEAQLRFYDDLEAETGLRWSAVVLSGDTRPSAHAALYGRGQLVPGKSVHAYLSTWAEVSEPGALALRQRAVDALCALTGGDAAVRDLSRKMRLGGALARVETQEVGGGRARVQTCLRAERVSYSLQEIVDGLEAACARRGIVVSSMLDALQACAMARTRARDWDKAAEQGTVSEQEAQEARDALLELALEIRLSGAVSPEQRLLLGKRGAPKGPLAVGEQGGTTRQIEVGHSSGSWDADTTILTHASGQSGTAEALWNSLLRGWRVPDVHCLSHADTHASAYLTRWGSDAYPRWTVHCPTCGKIPSKRPFADLESRLDSSLDGIEDLSPASAAAPAAPVPPQDGTATAQAAVPVVQKAATPTVPDLRALFTTFLEELEAPIKAHQADFPAMGERDFDVEDLEPVEIAEESGDLSVPVYKEGSIYRLEPTKTAPAPAPAPQAPAPQVPQTYTSQVLADAASGETARWLVASALADAERRQADALAEWIEAERLIFKEIVDLDEARGGCKRGPTTHYAHERSSVISSSRATCVSWGCPSCGLRKKAAVRAALRVYSSTRLETWTGAGISYSTSDEKGALALTAALRRWKDDAPSSRSWIGLETSPGTIELLVAWATAEDAPRLKLQRTLARGTQCAPGEAGDLLDEIADRLDLEATGAHDSRHCVLRGGREDRSAVSDLLECVVGRGRALKKKGLRRGPKGKIEAASASAAPASIVVATYDKLSTTIQLGGGVHRAQGSQVGEVKIHEADLSTLDEGKVSIRWAPGHTRPPSDLDHLRSPEELAELPPTPYQWLRDHQAMGGIKKIHRKTKVDPVLLEAGDATISMGARGGRVVRGKKKT